MYIDLRGDMVAVLIHWSIKNDWLYQFDFIIMRVDPALDFVYLP